MNRREALGKLSVLSGGALVLMSGILDGCNLAKAKRTSLTEKDVPFLDEIGETIIPATATSPGAKAAQIGVYMLAMVNDCYSEKRRHIFIEGLNAFDETCRQQYKSDFIELSSEQKRKFLQQLNKEAQTNSKETEHYFSMLRSLSINGYLTSEVGATKALRYDAVPGSYQGCIAYKKDDKPWSTS